METIVFSENVSVLPHMLDTNIEETLEKVVRDKYRQVCNKKWGYITGVDSIRILENIVNRVGFNIFFKIAVTAERFLPKEGTVISANVQMCFVHGLLCKFHELSILVPMSTITSGKFEGGVLRTVSRTVRKGDLVTVRLTNVKYEKHKYSAIAVLEEM
jgi:DNA-directed RNA polymerase subunit E'/Rpb7